MAEKGRQAMNNAIGAQTPEGEMWDAIELAKQSGVGNRGGLSFTLRTRSARTPAWASKEWHIYRQQYFSGTIRWDDIEKRYVFYPTDRFLYDADQLAAIAVFMRDQTQIHKDELWKRNCDRTAKQAVREVKKPRR